MAASGDRIVWRCITYAWNIIFGSNDYNNLTQNSSLFWIPPINIWLVSVKTYCLGLCYSTLFTAAQSSPTGDTVWSTKMHRLYTASSWLSSRIMRSRRYTAIWTFPVTVEFYWTANSSHYIICISTDLAAAADRCMMMLGCSIVLPSTQTVRFCRCKICIQWQQNVPTCRLGHALDLHLKVMLTFTLQRFHLCGPDYTLYKVHIDSYYVNYRGPTDVFAHRLVYTIDLLARFFEVFPHL